MQQQRPGVGTVTGSRRVHLLLTLALALTLGALAARPGETSAQSTKLPFVLTDRTVKLRLLRHAAEPPRILIFGGSRAGRIEPAYFKGKTGLPGFNLAFQNGRPEDAWAFVNYARRKFPDTPLQAVWFIHVEAFRKQGLSPGLIQEEELSRWFPAALIAAEKKKLPQTAADVPPGRDLALTHFGADGVVLRNRYDLAEERGRPLSRAIDWSIETALKRYATTTAALDPRSMRYFEKTMGLLAEVGTTQTIVLMPLHPRLLTAVRKAGWNARHREVMAYLQRLQATYGFSLLDCSELASIGGDRQGFYDGFHVKRANARRSIDTVIARFPEAFAGRAASGD